MRQAAMTDPRPLVLRGKSEAADESSAVAELHHAIHQEGEALVLFFASPRFDPERLGAALRDAFSCPVMGCTTAGEVTAGGYQDNALVGVSFAGSAFRARTQLIERLSEFTMGRALELAGALAAPPVPGMERLGFLLVDGLSMKEELLASQLQSAFGGMTIVGGSAGDGLAFRETRVFAGGSSARDAAAFCLLETSVPFRAFKSQHFRPTDKKLVITEAEPHSRLVTEIDGLPAAQAYAEMLGMDPGALGPAVFSEHPVILQLAGECYVRSIQRVTPEGGLVFFCAIDDGLVLTLAEGVGLGDSLRLELQGLERDLGPLSLVLGCDCILRRLECERRGIGGQIREILKPYPFVGFSTYGEQYNGVHVNQTLTGIAFGAAA
jgi:hypothetical protein